MAMTGAMSAAVSGLKSQMDALNVVGNNVANVNTYGYKAGRVTFRESVYNTLNAGSAGTATVGGTNPSQIGYGCSVGTIDLDMTTQSLTSTGLATDCAIQGDGFFLVGSKQGITGAIDNTDDYKSLMLSRVGDFKVDPDGYLTDGAGNIIYGFVTCNGTPPQNGNDVKDATQSDVPGLSGEAISTQLVPIRLPLAIANKDQAQRLGGEVGDAIFPGVNGGVNDYTDEYAGNECISYKDLKIDQNGRISCTTSNGDPITVGYIALGTVVNPNGLSHTSGPYYSISDSAGDLTIGTPGGAITGYLNNIGRDGQVPDDTDGSLRLPETGSSLMTAFLEDSGTDLATEFSNMIIYQRGYQANTRIITVTDSMLEELVNIKR